MRPASAAAQLILTLASFLPQVNPIAWALYGIIVTQLGYTVDTRITVRSLATALSRSSLRNGHLVYKTSRQCTSALHECAKLNRVSRGGDAERVEPLRCRSSWRGRASRQSQWQTTWNSPSGTDTISWGR
jgi:hypothetical protein